MKYTQLFEEFINEAMIQVSNKSIKSNKSKIDTSLIDKLVKQIAPVLNSEHSGTLTKKGYEDVIMAIAKNISGSGALQDPGVIFENKLNEAKEYSFTFNYNTDEDDVEYIQNILMDAGVDAIAEPGLDSEEMVVKAKNAVELRKAKKAIQADGFEIHESVVNEGDMTKFYDGFIVLDSKTKKTYKFKYVKGTKNTEVESNAISKLASSTKQPSSNFMVHGFVQKGEWNNSKEKTIDESFINEAYKFYDLFFNSHVDHNPECDILEGHLDKDSLITYGIYVKGPKEGLEFMEYYSGSNYKPTSDKRSSSRLFMVDKIPSKYKSMWEDLKKIYQDEYAGSGRVSTRNESVVNEGINAKDIKVGTILNFKDGETWKVTKTSGISSGKIFAAPYGDTKKSYVSIPLEFSIESLEKDVTSIE
jgi:hypothetical protein